MFNAQAPPQSPPARSASTAAPLAAPLADVLRELAGVIDAVTPGQFTHACGEQFYNGSIGGHVRHCFDHARALLDGHASGEVDYDSRRRGTDVEHCSAAARAEAARLIDLAVTLGHADAELPLSLTILPTRDGVPVRVASTLGRELAFVLSHTIHHNALVRSMAFSLGVTLPRTFGYAPSTLAHFDTHADQEHHHTEPAPAPCAR